MTDSDLNVREAPKPHETLSDEGGRTISWLDAAWSFEDIFREWDWLELTPDSLAKVWMACRWTTDEERADPDRLYDLFGCDPEDVDTSVVYWTCKPDTPGAHLYWTTEGPHRKPERV